MSAVLVIFKKEVAGFFKSPWFLFVYSFFGLLLGVRFLISLDEFIQKSMMPQGKPPNIHDALFIQHLNWVYMMFLVLIPLMTMRLISEEKKERTMDLLLTSPISTLEFVMGKFLAAWFVAITMLFLAFLFPLFTSTVSTFDWGPLLGSYMGMILLAGFNVGLCLVASSLTTSTVMSGFLGFIFILVTMIYGSSGIQVNNAMLSMMLEQLSLGVHLHDFFQGIVTIKSLVFLISGVGFLCFVSQRLIETLRWK